MPTKPWQRWNLPAPKSEASKGELSLVDYEVYSGIEVHQYPFFVRLDGWGFHSLTKRLKMKKPFDRRLPSLLAKVAKTFFIPFNPLLCYIFSDEANFLFLQPSAFRRIEKIDSVFAGLFSSHFTKLAKIPAAFDSRVIPIGKRNIAKYLVWRQAECWRNHNNAWAQWVAIEREHLSPRSANKRLEGMNTAQLCAYCKDHGLDLNKTPAWQRFGILLYREGYSKRGYDPIRKIDVVVERKRVKTDYNFPLFRTAQGKAFLKRILQQASTAL